MLYMRKIITEKFFNRIIYIFKKEEEDGIIFDNKNKHLKYEKNVNFVSFFDEKDMVIRYNHNKFNNSSFCHINIKKINNSNIKNIIKYHIVKLN